MTFESKMTKNQKRWGIAIIAFIVIAGAFIFWPKSKEPKGPEPWEALDVLQWTEGHIETAEAGQWTAIYIVQDISLSRITIKTWVAINNETTGVGNHMEINIFEDDPFNIGRDYILLHSDGDIAYIKKVN